MVRFGATLGEFAGGMAVHRLRRIKQLCDRGVSPRVFNSKLIVEIDAVHVDFRSRLLSREAPIADMRRAAVLSYLAVLKISKKYHKSLAKSGREDTKPEAATSSGLPPAVEKELRASSFCVALRDPSLFSRAREDTDGACKPLEASTTSSSDDASREESCPVCLEPMAADCARLPCRHAFCWACLASCAANGIKQCPVCRADQSLNPVDIEIEALLDAADGAAAVSKYSPGVVLDRTPPPSPDVPRRHDSFCELLDAAAARLQQQQRCSSTRGTVVAVVPSSRSKSSAAAAGSRPRGGRPTDGPWTVAEDDLARGY